MSELQELVYETSILKVMSAVDEQHMQKKNLLTSLPVAPSISSITTKTGFVLPTAEPDSRAGRIRSSTIWPVRASL